MARIDFAFGAPNRLRTACVIARKRYQAGDRVIAYCSDPQRLVAFDRLLWAFDATSFVPHVNADDPLAPDTPVVLCAAVPAGVLQTWGNQGSTPWLLNLDDACAPDAEQFARIMEVVSDQDEDRLQARQRWKAYTASGHDMHGHDLKQTPKEDSD